MFTPLSQTQSWLDWARHFALPIAVTAFSVVVSWWRRRSEGTLSFVWDWSIPRGPDNHSLAELIGLGHSTFARIGLQTAIGLICLITLPAVVRGCALVSAGFQPNAAHRRRRDAPEDRRADRAEGGRPSSAETTALRRLEA